MAADDRNRPDLSGGSPDEPDFGVRLTWPGADEAPGGSEPAHSAGEAPDPDRAQPGVEEEPVDASAGIDEPAAAWPEHTEGEGPRHEAAAEWTGDDTGFAEPSGSERVERAELAEALPLLGGTGRLEPLHAALNALALRVEALASANAGMRSALGDRIGDHADTLSRLVRGQAADLEEHQRSTERALSELRRASADSDEAIHRMSERLDELAADVAELGRLVAESTDEGRNLATASDKLSRQVIEGLDVFGDRLLERLDELDASLAAEVGSGRAETARVRKAVGELGSGGGSVESLRTRIEQIHDDIGGLASLAPDPAIVHDQLRAIRDDLGELFAALDARPEVTAGAPGLDEIRQELAAIREGFEVIRRQQDELAEAARGLLVLQDSIELVPVDEEHEAALEQGPDLAGELSALREAIEARSSDSSLDVLQEELAALRSAVAALEVASPSPVADLDPVNAELAGMRSELGELRRSAAKLEAEVVSWRADQVTLGAPAGEPSSTLLAAAGSDPAALDALRAEIVALRRRMNLKAKPSPVTLDDEQLARLADAVTERLRTVLGLAADDQS